MESEIIAVPDCLCFEAKWSSLQEFADSISGNNLDMLNNMNKSKKNIFISRLSGTKSLVLSHSLKREFVKKNSILFYEGDASDKFYLVASGRLKVTSKDKALWVIEEGNFIGEIGLINDCERTASVYAMTDSELYYIIKENFQAVLDKRLIDFLQKRMINTNTLI